MSGIEGLLAGHTLAGRYRIEEVIGRGGFAAVYRARDERLRRTVAVKVVMAAPPDEVTRERVRARFHREARVAAQLRHPNVVTIYDFGTDETLSLDFLVMELLHGEDLAARLARLGPPPMDLSLRVLREAAEGVAAGHQAGLVHRDVKPGNVFLEERSGTDVFRVCVLDFGIAQIVEGEDAVTSLTQGRTPLSASYASPEQLRDERPLTRASDVYGLGVIGYELLTGERLFDSSAPESARRTVPSLRSRNPEVPASIAAVVERALAYDPGGRYSDAGELARALAAAEASAALPHAPPPVRSGAAEPPPPADPAPGGKSYRARRAPRLPEEAPTPVPAASRSRSAFPLVLLTVLALAALVGWWALRGGGERETGGVTVNEADATYAGGLVTPGSGEAMAASAEAVHAEGLRLFGAGDLAGAIERFRAAVAAAPTNAFYRNNLGWALHLAGRVEEAERELEEVIRLDPARDIAYANLGEVRLAQGDTVGAVRLYERFLELNGDPRREGIAARKLATIR